MVGRHMFGHRFENRYVWNFSCVYVIPYSFSRNLHAPDNTKHICVQICVWGSLSIALLIGNGGIFHLTMLLKPKRVMVEYFSWFVTCVFFFRSPTASRIRAKMLYATSKDGLRRALDGIHYEVQATDPTEMGIDVIQDRAN